MKVFGSFGLGFGLVILTLITMGAKEVTSGMVNQTCNVPEVYDSIQAAVDDSQCALVIVASGTYTENVKVSRTVVIRGQGIENTIVSGFMGISVFTIDEGSDVKLSHMTLTKGSANSGGAVVNNGILTITASMLSDNSAEMGGGGIYNQRGELTIIDSTIRNNSATWVFPAGRGGGINNNSGSVTIIGSSILNNSAVGSGGGILQTLGTLMVTSSIISGNVSYGGAGILNDTAKVTIIESAILNNEAQDRGGDYLALQVTIRLRIVRSAEIRQFQAAGSLTRLVQNMRNLDLSLSTVVQSQTTRLKWVGVSIIRAT